MNNTEIRDDGLKYCCTCGKPRQFKQTIDCKEFVLPIICDCIKNEQAKQKRNEFAEKVDSLRRGCFIDKQMMCWTFDSDDGKSQEMTSAARAYCNNFDMMKKTGKGLLLYGNCGNGKSFMSACIANELVSKGYKVRMTTLPQVVNNLWDADGRQEYIDSFQRYSLLILDDLGAERQTEYAQEIVFELINARYISGLPLIVTTNLGKDEITNPKDIQKRRIFDRLIQMCHPVHFSGNSRRRQELRDTFGGMQDLLGLGSRGES